MCWFGVISQVAFCTTNHFRVLGPVFVCVCVCVCVCRAFGGSWCNGALRFGFKRARSNWELRLLLLLYLRCGFCFCGLLLNMPKGTLFAV